MRVCKKIAVCILLPFFTLQGFSQTDSKSVNIPSINMPKAPEVPKAPQFPTVGNFYVPGFKEQSGKTVLKPANPPLSAPGTSDAAGQADGGSDSKALSDAKSLATAFANKNLLTAGDITSLYDSGLFGSLSSITGTGTVSGTGTANASTEALLKKILDNLEELKAGQSNLSPEKQQELAAYQKDSKLFKTRDPKILRFRINGYNISDSVTTSYFSETEPDGTFLFTGDRTYYADGRARNETFYILFKAVKSNGAAVTFDVIPSLVQDFENKNSFVYRFSRLKGLTAEKTGNLVVLHSSSDDLNVDLLLDIDGDR